ncbi:succinate dehydrogenase, cytochrome b556 subunit [Legionella dresdenensis]|uniref:Succinate dehydrogenase cytochrome b556 subunit n=1 Tax=Legionella dresdenensis TaxID=450200 RepID=A0ABV8CFT4_9GAMM
MNQKRPVNLDLGTMKFPPMAIASILHRVSGVVMFLLLPLMIYFLDLSLKGRESYDAVLVMLANPVYKLAVWAFMAALGYHLLAGIRHLAMDLGFGEELSAGRRSAILVIVLSVIVTIILGFWIW